jgi:hypothetical protein
VLDAPGFATEAILVKPARAAELLLLADLHP